MPFVNIKVAGPTLAPEQVQHLQQDATKLMAEVLRKKAELTAVLIEHVPATSWTVGGKPVSAAAHLDVKVTEGTNTAEEKGLFVRTNSTSGQHMLALDPATPPDVAQPGYGPS